MPTPLLDAAGRRRSPATMPGYHCGRTPRNKGLRYPADPPSVEEIVAVMRTAGTSTDGARLRALVVVLWRAGLRVSEALALAETDLDARRGSIVVRRGKGGKRREVGMDTWAWEQLAAWLAPRRAMPVGPLLCVIHGPTQGAAMVRVVSSRPASSCRGGGRRPTPLRAAPAAPCTRSRDGARRRPIDCHPTPTRPHQPRHHIDLPARHRQRRNH